MTSNRLLNSLENDPDEYAESFYFRSHSGTEDYRKLIESSHSYVVPWIFENFFAEDV